MSQKKYFIDRQRYDEACADLQINDMRDGDGGKPWVKGYQANYVGCTRRMFNLYIAEADQKPIPWAKLQVLAKLLQCSPLWLCGESDIRSKNAASFESVDLYRAQCDLLDNLLESLGIHFCDYDAESKTWQISIDSRNKSEKYLDEKNGRPFTPVRGTMTIAERSILINVLLQDLIDETAKYVKIMEERRTYEIFSQYETYD